MHCDNDTCLDAAAVTKSTSAMKATPSGSLAVSSRQRRHCLPPAPLDDTRHSGSDYCSSGCMARRARLGRSVRRLLVLQCRYHLTIFDPLRRSQLTDTNKSPDTGASQKPPTVGYYLLTSGRCVAIRVPGQRLLDAASASTLKPPPQSQAQASSPAAPAQEAAPASCTQAHRAAHAVSLQQSILIRVSTRPPSAARTVVQADPSSEHPPGKDTASAHHHSE